MTLENLKRHHARLKWLASGEFTERDFDYKIERSDNEHGDSKHKGEGGWCTMGDFEGTKRKELIISDATRTLEIFEKKYDINYKPIPKKKTPTPEEITETPSPPEKPKEKKKEKE